MFFFTTNRKVKTIKTKIIIINNSKKKALHGENIQFILVLILFQSILDYFGLFKFDVVFMSCVPATFSRHSSSYKILVLCVSLLKIGLLANFLVLFPLEAFLEL